ncbi:hypothetical protein ACJX0J_039482, partial [Zea mays]
RGYNIIAIRDNLKVCKMENLLLLSLQIKSIIFLRALLHERFLTHVRTWCIRAATSVSTSMVYLSTCSFAFQQIKFTWIIKINDALLVFLLYQRFKTNLWSLSLIIALVFSSATLFDVFSYTLNVDINYLGRNVKTGKVKFIRISMISLQAIKILPSTASELGSIALSMLCVGVSIESWF